MLASPRFMMEASVGKVVGSGVPVNARADDDSERVDDPESVGGGF